MNLLKIATELEKTAKRGKFYQTNEAPTSTQLVSMVEEADNACADTFGTYSSFTIKFVVRKMLSQNDSASRILANPQLGL